MVLAVPESSATRNAGIDLIAMSSVGIVPSVSIIRSIAWTCPNRAVSAAIWVSSSACRSLSIPRSCSVVIRRGSAAPVGWVKPNSFNATIRLSRDNWLAV
ncbi:hypothetical protein [Saccharopolyspora sp. 5N708]|uniref:hypothetical protein n=1 Tax=Saccharopolyspora sp. 5N708 TaxID=3457424 RepID=UPI003FCF1AD0